MALPVHLDYINQDVFTKNNIHGYIPMVYVSYVLVLTDLVYMFFIYDMFMLKDIIYGIRDLIL